jgi:hypothetical protein
MQGGAAPQGEPHEALRVDGDPVGEAGLGGQLTKVRRSAMAPERASKSNTSMRRVGLST